MPNTGSRTHSPKIKSRRSPSQARQALLFSLFQSVFSFLFPFSSENDSHGNSTAFPLRR